MDLVLKLFDGRKPNLIDIIDQESNRVVGRVKSNSNSRGI